MIQTVFLNRKHTDILILQVFGQRGFIQEDLISWMAYKLNIPVIMVLRGGRIPEFCQKYPGWVRSVFNRAKAIVTPSNYIKRNISWMGYDIDVIPNVLDLSGYPFQPRQNLKPNLLWMRAFYWFYGPEMAVKVLHELKKEYHDAHLTMAGPDRGLLEKTRKLAQEFNLIDSVNFPGFLNHPKKIQISQSNDIYINTNVVDNMPVSVIEMAALGLPVVATNVGGMPDMLTNEHNGLLVPSDDPVSMAAAIDRLIQHPDLAAKLSWNGRKLAESCAWDKVKQDWVQLFAKVMDSDGKLI